MNTEKSAAPAVTRVGAAYPVVSTSPRMPDQPKTPHRSFRIPDDEYLPAQAKAKDDPRYGNLTAFVRAQFRDYVEENDE